MFVHLWTAIFFFRKKWKTYVWVRRTIFFKKEYSDYFSSYTYSMFVLSGEKNIISYDSGNRQKTLKVISFHGCDKRCFLWLRLRLFFNLSEEVEIDQHGEIDHLDYQLMTRVGYPWETWKWSMKHENETWNMKMKKENETWNTKHETWNLKHENEKWK